MTTTDDIPGLEEGPQLTIPGVVPANDDTLTSITNLARRLIEVQDLIAEREALLKLATDEEKMIAESRLPDLMRAVGLTELTVQGRKITLRPSYYATIPSTRSQEAMAWLRERNMGAVIKETIEVPLDAVSRLQEAQIPYTAKGSIHPSTLRALVKEQIENDPNFPRELFGAHVVEKAAVKGR